MYKTLRKIFLKNGSIFTVVLVPLELIKSNKYVQYKIK